MNKVMRMLSLDDIPHIRDIFGARQSDYILYTWTSINAALVESIEKDFDSFLLFGLFEDGILDSIVITKPMTSYCWNLFLVMHRGNENREEYIDANGNKIDVNDKNLRNYVLEYYESTGRHAYYTAAPKPFYDVNKFYSDYRQNTHYTHAILEEIPAGELTSIEFHKQFVYRKYDVPVLIIHRQYKWNEEG